MPIGGISEGQLADVDLDSPVKELESIDCYDAATELTAAAKEADEAGNLGQALVYRLMGTICHLHFQPRSKEQPYGPLAVYSNGLRTAAGGDFSRDESEALFSVRDRIRFTPLKARIADLTWISNRGNVKAAREAISGFCEMVESALDGAAKRKFGKDIQAGDHLLRDILDRAVSIAFATGWERSENARLRAAIERNYLLSKGVAGPNFSRAAELALNTSVTPADEVIDAASQIRDKALGAGSVDEAEWASQTALRAAAALKDDAKIRDAKIALSSVYETKAQRMGDAPALKTHALQQAIDALRGARDVKERRRALHLKLADAQINFEEEFGRFEHEMDLTDLVTQTRSAFQPLDLYEGLRSFAVLAIPRDPDEILKEAQSMGAEFPLSGLFPVSVMDDQGRTIAKEGVTEIGEASRHLILRNEAIQMHVAVAGQIEHAREILLNDKGLTEDHLAKICEFSPFVPAGASELFARGFMAFFRRDYVLAGMFLVPYLEACLREGLRQAGEPTTVIKEGGTESNLMLSSMLGSSRPSLEKVFSKRIVFTIENIFEHPLGETIRHRLCHGLLHRNSFFSATMVYGIWLMFSITMLPLLSDWEEVSKAIAASLGDDGPRTVAANYIGRHWCDK